MTHDYKRDNRKRISIAIVGTTTGGRQSRNCSGQRLVVSWVFSPLDWRDQIELAFRGHASWPRPLDTPTRRRGTELLFIGRLSINRRINRSVTAGCQSNYRFDFDSKLDYVR